MNWSDIWLVVISVGVILNEIHVSNGILKNKRDIRAVSHRLEKVEDGR